MGRTLDFLIQEMNREVNTVGSKADDLELSQAAIAAKSTLEKLREQVQNLEWRVRPEVTGRTCS